MRHRLPEGHKARDMAGCFVGLAEGVHHLGFGDPPSTPAVAIDIVPREDEELWLIGKNISPNGLREVLISARAECDPGERRIRARRLTEGGRRRKREDKGY